MGTVLLKRIYVLVFIEHGNRRMHLGGVSTHPTGQRTVQQARNLALTLVQAPRMHAICERLVGTLRRGCWTAC